MYYCYIYTRNNKTFKIMKVKERIEELKPFCPELSDYDWCTSPLFVAKALNKLWRELGCYHAGRLIPETEHNRRQLKKYKYAEKSLTEFIKNNIDGILELSLEEKNNMYLEILYKAVSHYEYFNSHKNKQ